MKLSDSERAIVEKILHDLVPDYEVRAFGSRVHGKNLKKFSDLDLAVLGPTSLDSRKYGALDHAFSESDLPFRVDIVDLHDAPDWLKEKIDEAHEIIQLATR